MYAPAENFSNFTGVLVRRQYKPGQKYIQLVFETTEGLRLSISRNLRLVRSLSVGGTYKVIGPLYEIGDKTYVHEPTATLIRQEKRTNKKLWVFGLTTLIVALAITSYITLLSPPKTANSAKQALKKVTLVQQQVDPNNKTVAAPSKTDQTSQPQASSPAVTAVKHTSTSKSTSSSNTSNQTSAQQPTTQTTNTNTNPQNNDPTSDNPPDDNNQSTPPSDGGDGTDPTCDPTTDPSCPTTTPDPTQTDPSDPSGTDPSGT